MLHEYIPIFASENAKCDKKPVFNFGLLAGTVHQVRRGRHKSKVTEMKLEKGLLFLQSTDRIGLMNFCHTTAVAYNLLDLDRTAY